MGVYEYICMYILTAVRALLLAHTIYLCLCFSYKFKFPQMEEKLPGIGRQGSSPRGCQRHLVKTRVRASGAVLDPHPGPVFCTSCLVH